MKRISIVAAAASAALTLGMVGTASAATVEVTGSVPHFWGAPGEANNVTAEVSDGNGSDYVMLRDTGATITEARGCRLLDRHSAWCPLSGTSPVVGIHSGDLDDSIKAYLEDIGTAHVFAGAGEDNVLVSSGPSVVHAGSEDDTVVAGHYGDSLLGEGGHDKLTAGAGDDTLDGGDGTDLLTGDEGVDEHLGGPGNDMIYSDDNHPDAMTDCGSGMDITDNDYFDVQQNCEY